MNDDFYIGYRKTAPARLARFVATAAAVICAVVVSVSIVIGRMQQEAGNGNYEFGNPATVEGTVRTVPILHIEIEETGRAALLVGDGKHGASDAIADAANSRIQLTATRIERDGTLMLETTGEVEILDAPTRNSPNRTDAGTEVSLAGELVDSKCYLGVMNPGRGKVHRGCAAECLRGGVPPALLVRTHDGQSHVIALVPADTAPSVDPEWAARNVEVSGVLTNLEGFGVLTYEHIALAN